jgi:uncharacterized membrane protein YfcA
MTPDTLFIMQMSVLLLAIGAVAGFLSGLLGVGGGIIFVPALYFCLHAIGVDDSFAMRVAVGTSLSLICVTGATSAFAHWRRGSVDTESLRRWALPLVVSAVCGSLFAGVVNSHVLRIIFACVTVVISIYMFIMGAPKASSFCLVIPVRVQKAVMASIALISSLIGVGGAIMSVPFMVLMGYPMQRAAGTGAALGLMIALPGSVTYMITGLFHLDELPPYSVGYVNLLGLAMIIPASVLLAPLGVQASHSLPRDMLKRVFAVVLMIVSLRMFMTL